MKDIAIVMVNYNNKKLLRDCLASIKDSTHKVSYEIIVSDNGSKDGSQDMVRQDFPHVILIENKENLGFIKASNQGLRIAKAKYSILLNDDTLVKDRAFDKMFDFMQAHPKAGACGPKLLNIDGTPQRQGGVLGSTFWLATQPKQVDFVIGACLMVRKETIDQVGLMDENLFFYNDDLDWCKRIKKAGWKIYFLPQAEVIHYGGYSTKRTFNRRMFVEGFGGGIYFVGKHYGKLAQLTYRILLAPIGLLTLIIMFLFYFKSDRKDKLLAYLEILRILIIA